MPRSMKQPKMLRRSSAERPHEGRCRGIGLSSDRAGRSDRSEPVYGRERTGGTQRVANAKLLADDPEATQEAVDAATEAILMAIDNLQDVTTTPGGSTDEPGTTPDDGNTDTDNNGGTGSDTGTGNGGTETNGSDTAAENSTTGFAAMSVVALGALQWHSRREIL